MALYEYECDSCGHRFEIIRKFSDPPPKTCPSCGADALRKLFAAPAIQFKGSGWYITDYAQKSAKPDTQDGGKEDGKKAGTAEAGKTQASQSDSGGTTDAKPAATAAKDSSARDAASSSSSTATGTSSSKDS